MNRKVTFIICSLLLCSCNREVDFYFNFGSQSLCVYKSSFYNLSIENDSITPDGKSYEGAISLFWTDSANSPPRRIYLDRIPKGYSVYRGGIKSSEKRISLKGNSVYTITSTGIAAVGCSIKVLRFLQSSTCLSRHQRQWQWSKVTRYGLPCPGL